MILILFKFYDLAGFGKASWSYYLNLFDLTLFDQTSLPREMIIFPDKMVQYSELNIYIYIYSISLVVSEEQDQANIHIQIWSFAHQDLRINNSCGVLVVARERALGRIWG